MINDPITSIMKELGLHGMHDAYLEQQELTDINTLSFTDRVKLLLDAQKEDFINRRTTNLLRHAKFRYPRASMKTLLIDERRPGLNRSQVLQLALSEWVPKGDVVIVTGASGTGKSFLGCALGHAACKKGYSVRFHRINKLCVEIATRRMDGSVGKFLDRLAKVDLLVLDDLGRTDLTSDERRDLLDIIEERYDRRATIVTSQFTIGNWHGVIGDVNVADAMLDRLVHHAHRIELKGESLRKLDPDLRRCIGITDDDDDDHDYTDYTDSKTS